MDVLITLAGQSKRFYNAGYKKPKFLLPIGNSTVISEVIKKFDDNDVFSISDSSIIYVATSNSGQDTLRQYSIFGNPALSRIQYFVQS